MADALKLIVMAKEKRLKTLDLSNCGLTEVPQEVLGLKWLKILKLNNNPELSDLTPLSGLVNLQGLYIVQTPVSDITPLSGLVKLQELWLFLTPVSDLTPLSRLVNLQTLYLFHTPVSDLMPLSGLMKLATLKAWGTQVSDLMPLSGLVNLQRLDVSHTQVSDLTPLGRLVNLQRLEVSQTQVSDLTPLSELVKLWYLEVSQTPVSDLMPLSRLVNLQRLVFSQTQVSDLTPLSGLVKLHELHISQTQVSDLTPLSGLVKLWYLKVSQTPVSDLTPLIAPLEKWLIVECEDCPSLPPAQAVAAKKGGKALLRYFQELKKGAVVLNEAKVLLVGQGRSGKTSLRIKLEDPNAPMPAEEKTTLGVDIVTLSCERDFRLHLWDFGGQSVQYYAHQFFLTKNSLYVLLSNEAKEDRNFSYWLNIIELLGGGSKVLVVQNERLGHFDPISNEAGIREHFGNVVNPFHRLDLSKAGGEHRKHYDALRDAILLHARQLPHVGTKQPKSWVDVREALAQIASSNDNRHYVRWEEFERLCREAGVSNPLTMQDYAVLFTHLGNCLYFPGDDVLCDYLFLRPQWVMEALYALLHHKVVLDGQGTFTAMQAREIWSGKEYKGMHDQLIRLLLNFHLCYRMKEEGRYVVPQRRPSVGSAYPWSEREQAEASVVVYDYTFMPQGLLTRLTCRLHEKIEGQHVWKEAVVFVQSATRALVREAFEGDRPEANRIEILVAGERRTELLNRIVEELDEVHASARYANLQVKKLVPCCCEKCAHEPFFFDFKYLCDLLDDGESQERCQKSRKMVDITAVLRHTGIPTPWEKLLDEARELTVDNREREALDLLHRRAPDDKRVWMLLSQERGLADAEIMGATGQEEFSIGENSLRRRLLMLLDELGRAYQK
ncbi:MAG: leucine-rich repeat domain-containing protein [Bacteroidetes bacterium]|nr:leucine-rich repeat domain-containing protein [Bacteroidota bacterium]